MPAKKISTTSVERALRQAGRARLLAIFALLVSLSLLAFAMQSGSALHPPHRSQESAQPLRGQTQQQADAKSAGCITCHIHTDEPTMHPTGTVFLGCTDCHGGDPGISIARGTAQNSSEYNSAKERAHVQPRDAHLKDRSAVPERMYTEWLKESYAYVKFVNPGDLRAAPETCGSAGCHASETRAVSTSMMTHGGMLWGAALYNNGGYPTKNTRFGESYEPERQTAIDQNVSAAATRGNAHQRRPGITRSPLSLGNFATGQRAPHLRTRRAQKVRTRQSQPRRRSRPSRRPTERPRPRHRTRTDPVFLGLQKTRLLDPIMSLPGTNDHPGDYRGSGCTACHVVYANDNAPCIPRAMRNSAIPDSALLTTRPSRKMNRAIRSSTRSRNPFLRASAWSATSTPART